MSYGSARSIQKSDSPADPIDLSPAPRTRLYRTDHGHSHCQRDEQERRHPGQMRAGRGACHHHGADRTVLPGAVVMEHMKDAEGSGDRDKEKREDKQNPNFLLVVDIDVKKLGDTGVRQLFDAIAQAAKPHLRGVELAIVPTAQNFGQAALKDAVPFYEK